MLAGLRPLIILTALGLLSGCVDLPKSPYVDVHDLVTGIDDARSQAEAGSADDQYRVGARYENVLLDYQEAARWYRMAALERHPEAIYRLCVLSDQGRGVPQDYQEALRWCRLAADHGHAKAMLTIGLFFEKGRGLPKDATQAHQWYNLAAANGLAEGAKRRDRLAQDMTAAQIAQAQFQARNWKAKYQDAKD
jgi:TPR repeat protein